MPITRFVGKIFPSGIKVSAANVPVVALVLQPGFALDGLEARFEMNIKDSVVEVICTTNRNEPNDFEQLYMSAFELTRATVDTMAFSIGRGLTLVMDTAFPPNNIETAIFVDLKHLPALVTSYETGHGIPSQSFNEVLQVILQDRALMMALDDLTATMEAPYRSAINCARTIEAIGHFLLPVTCPQKPHTAESNLPCRDFG